MRAHQGAGAPAAREEVKCSIHCSPPSARMSAFEGGQVSFGSKADRLRVAHVLFSHARAYRARRLSTHQIAMTACSPTKGQSTTPAIRNIDPEMVITAHA